jgi:predicted ATPase
VATSALESERFVLGRKLGAGGMGVVYEAEDRVTHAVVALKVLRQPDGDALYRFKHEFRLLANLSHPNLVRLGELFCESGQWFFTMELIHGKTFGDHVRAPADAPQPFDETRLRAALRQLAGGLAALHAAGYVHRDVKPANVLVADDGRVVLLDFGLAAPRRRDVEAHTDSTVMGTAAYMAPEQITTTAIGPAVDLYAVGVMLFESLTGVLPFVGRTFELMRDKQLRPAPAPSQVQPGIPADLGQLCSELLDRNPRARPSMARVLARLDAATTTALETMDEAEAPFVGRADELRILEDAFLAVERGEPTSILIEGEPGVGKTAMVEHFLMTRPSPHLVTLRGRCYEKEQVPFKAFDGIVDALSHYLKRLPPVEAGALLPPGIHFVAAMFPVLRRVPVVANAVPLRRGVDDPGAARARAFDELKQLLLAVAEREQLVLFVDDLQWIDADSLQLLEELSRPLHRPRTLVLATTRPLARADGLWQRLRALFRPILLRGLSSQESVAFLATVAARLSTEQAEALIKDSGGHPLFLAELARAAEDHATGQSPRLEEVLWRRIQALAPADRRILEVAALAGGALSERVLARAAALRPGDCLARVSSLRVARLIKTERRGDRRIIEPFHDRVREAVTAHLDDAPALHLAIGRYMLDDADAETRENELGTIVSHLCRGAALIDTPDERLRLVTLSLEAARQTRWATAYEAALEQLVRAEALLPADAWSAAPTTMLALQRERIDLEYLLGRADAARARFAVALAHTRSDDERAELWNARIRMETARGEFAVAIGCARQALRELGVDLPERAGRVAIFRELVVLRFRQGRRRVERLTELGECRDARMRSTMQLLMSVTPATYFWDPTLMSLVMLKMASMSLQSGLTPESAFGFLGYGIVLTGVLGSSRKGFLLGELAIRMNERCGDGSLDARIYHLTGWYLTSWVQPFAQAIERLRRARELSFASGDMLYETYSTNCLALILELQGAPLDEWWAAASAALEVARRHGDVDFVARGELRLRALTGLRERRQAPDDAAAVEERTPMVRAHYHYYEALLAYYFGELEQAWRHIVAVEQHEGAFLADPEVVSFAFYRVLIAAEILATGAGDTQARLQQAITTGLTKLRRWARQCPENFATRRLLAEAAAARARGKHAEARAGAIVAAAAAQKQHTVGLEALAHELAARSCATAGRAAEAAEHRRHAVAAYRRWGAVAKAEALLG